MPAVQLRDVPGSGSEECDAGVEVSIIEVIGRDHGETLELYYYRENNERWVRMRAVDLNSLLAEAALSGKIPVDSLDPLGRAFGNGK